MKLKYDYEITHHYSDWVQKALPIGNGFLGAKVFGTVNFERIQINEKSLWTGGPIKEDHLNKGGNEKIVYEKLKEIQTYLAQDNYAMAAKLAENHLTGPQNREYGAYIPLIDYQIEFTNHDDYHDYTRELDLDTATISVSYSVNDKRFKRRYFSSYPDNLVVMHFESLDKEPFNLKINPINNCDVIEDTMSDETKIISNEKIKSMFYSFKDDTQYFEGEVYDNQRYFCGGLKVLDKSESTKLVYASDLLLIKNSTEVTLVFHAQTDYQQNYPLYRKDVQTVKEAVTSHLKHVKSDRHTLYNRHLKDYQKIYSKVKFELNDVSEARDKTTDALLKSYKKNEISHYLEMLVFQYGRYLLIASSREGDNALPANLQGIWNAAVNPAWNSDYHLNINLQMNYWPSLNTQLEKTFMPLLDYVESLQKAGELAAINYANIGEKGAWLTHTQNTIYGWTCPGWDYYWGWSPASNAWIMQNIYDYFRYTQDIEILQTRIFPLLEKTVAFWSEFLIYDIASDRYVSSPSYSPEHGPISIGNTYDQSLVTQLYKDYLHAVKYVKSYDTELYEKVSKQLPKLKALNVGESKQIKEWYEEAKLNQYEDGTQIPNTDQHHRHVSELVGLYPGTLFTDDYLKDAAKVTLNYRGDGGTGWSKANKINLWARLYDGDRAYKLLQEQIQNNILENLFNTHPPFQLDGNSGATSGIVEMLMQSHDEEIILLPALPKAWEKGHILGLRAQNNVLCDLYWEQNHLTHAKLFSTQQHKQVVKGIDLKKFSIYPNLYESFDHDTIELDFSASDTFEIRKTTKI